MHEAAHADYQDRPTPDEKEREAYYVHKTGALSLALGIDDPAAVARVLVALIGIASWPFIVPQQRLMLGPDGDTESGWAPLRAGIVAHGHSIVDNLLQGPV
ncbi:hypothetical protein [Streptomyces carpinensis]|uniref:Uncharacterized protein n=1 Tax=Streptomyces carpinensis TaxID=66369 RepID=A0ABV1W800_9ACTN|nr:hypothetical protein [Streptomyces carpinensis]